LPDATTTRATPPEDPIDDPKISKANEEISDINNYSELLDSCLRTLSV
jgi:hypothetical protein